MFSYRSMKISVFFVLFCGVLCNIGLHGDTLHLKNGQEWTDISNTPEGRYLVAIARFKQLIATGDSDGAILELLALKAAHPEMAGPDFDIFVEAEVLFADGKWFKAVRKYNKMLDGWPESPLYETALERQFSLGIAFLNGHKREVLKVLKLSAFDDGDAVMRDIADRAGDAPIAKRALISLAQGYEKKGEFIEAYLVWLDISSRWSNSELGTTAVLEMAQDQHSAYKGPNYDHTGLKSARTYYESYKLLPNREEVAASEVDEKLKTIDEQLAYKQYSIGEYYDRTGSSEGARLYYDEVIEKWPETSAAEMARARIEAKDLGIRKKESEPTKMGRQLFKASNTFVDNWFGLSYLAGKKK
jgi:tetratricopeptide (TPR) repeat protein